MNTVSPEILRKLKLRGIQRSSGQLPAYSANMADAYEELCMDLLEMPLKDLQFYPSPAKGSAGAYNWLLRELVLMMREEESIRNRRTNVEGSNTDE